MKESLKRRKANVRLNDSMRLVSMISFGIKKKISFFLSPSVSVYRALFIIEYWIFHTCRISAFWKFFVSRSKNDTIHLKWMEWIISFDNISIVSNFWCDPKRICSWEDKNALCIVYLVLHIINKPNYECLENSPPSHFLCPLHPRSNFSLLNLRYSSTFMSLCVCVWIFVMTNSFV